MKEQIKITIVTFISNNEEVNYNYIEFIKQVSKIFSIEALMFTDKKFENIPIIIKQIITKDFTKYSRIMNLLNETSNDYILCIDNDIELETKSIVFFIKEFIESNCSIAFGKIEADFANNIISYLVKIDKNLSHNYIRPFLWKYKIGISIPGQIFAIKKSAFLGKLPQIDTVFDDLTIGICAKKNLMSVFYTLRILGREKPKATFIELAKQRIRWSNGYFECIVNNKKDKQIIFLIYIHGFFYHLLWIPAWLSLYSMFQIHYIIGIIFGIIIAWMLANKKWKDIIWGIVYFFTFPLFHLIWLGTLIKNIVLYRGDK